MFINTDLSKVEIEVAEEELSIWFSTRFIKFDLVCFVASLDGFVDENLSWYPFFPTMFTLSFIWVLLFLLFKAHSDGARNSQ